MKEERILHILGEVDEKYIAEAAPDRKSSQIPVLKKLIIIAACLALLLVLTAAAYATNLFGLRDLLLPLISESSQSVDDGRIGLTGYQGSPEWKALAEWQAFVNEYDPDGTIYQNMNGQLDSSFARYSCYKVYSREMADKMDEIAEKYGLKLHTTSYNLQEHPELLELLGNFIGDNGYYTYMYEDGTFQVDGTIDFEDIGAWDFRLLRSVRGTFHDAMLDIGDVSEYQEVPYETACGITVILALSKSQAMILADLEDSFVTVHIPYGSNSGIKQSHLEILADSINFAALTPVVKPQISDTTQPVERDTETRKVYAATLRNLLYNNTLPDGKQTEMTAGASSQFAVADVDTDGKEELVLLYDPGVTAGATGYIIGYDAGAKNIYIQLEEFPAFAFLQNGNLKVLSSHNQTNGEMWPYSLYQYLSENDSYELRGYAYSEDKTFFEENNAFEHYPEYADTSGTGTVYYVGTHTWGTAPIDEADYIAWLEANHGKATELKVEYLPLTEESILTIEYSDNRADAVSASPEQHRTEIGIFENIMGFSGQWIQQISLNQHYERTYCADTVQGQVPIAESFGYEIDDHVCDLDGDGTTELICNVTYGADGAERIYVYRLHDGVVERGHIEDESIFSQRDIWGAGAITERYDAAQKKLLLTLTKTDSSTQTHEQSDYTHFKWEKYMDIAAPSEQ